jgi:hypothetical protein
VGLLPLTLCRDGHLHRGDITEMTATSMQSRLEGKPTAAHSGLETWLGVTLPLLEESRSLKMEFLSVRGGSFPN